MKKHIYAILLIVFVSSCMPSLHKALEKITANETNAKVALTSIKDTYPLPTAKWAAYTYPTVPKTTIVRDTTRQIITVPGDSVECEQKTVIVAGKTVTRVEKAKCPDLSYYLTTIKEYTNTIESNTAELEAKDLELDQKNKEIYDREQDIKAEKEAHAATVEAAKPYKWTVYIFAGLAFLLILWMAFKRVVIAYIKSLKPF